MNRPVSLSSRLISNQFSNRPRGWSEFDREYSQGDLSRLWAATQDVPSWS